MNNLYGYTGIALIVFVLILATYLAVDEWRRLVQAVAEEPRTFSDVSITRFEGRGF